MRARSLALILAAIALTTTGIYADSTAPQKLKAQPAKEVVFAPGDVLHFNHLDESGNVTPVTVISEPQPSPYADCTIISEGAGNRTIVLNGVRIVRVASMDVDAIAGPLIRAGICASFAE